MNHLHRVAGFLLIAALCGRIPDQATAASQTITLQPGWNLITFQVLPDDRSPAGVLAALKSETGNNPLYNSAAPANSNVVAAYDLASVQSGLGGSMQFRWRSFQPRDIDKLPDMPRIQVSHSHAADGTEIATLD